MSDEITVRWGWLKLMYVCTILAAGVAGAVAVFAPEAARSALAIPGHGRFLLGMAGSVYLAFALLSILGLRSPLKFAPVLLLQLCYKVIWLVAVFLPRLAAGNTPNYAIWPAIVFVLFVIGDLIAIPFGRVFAKEQGP